MEEKKKFIKEFVSGDVITSFFFLQKISLKVNPNTSQKYAELILKDKTSSILALILANPEQTIFGIPENSVVKVRGKVGKKSNKKFITVEKIRLKKDEETVSSYDLIPSSSKPSEQITRAFETKVKRFNNLYLQRICEFFLDDEIILQNFLKAPASLNENHNFLGGLAEHTFGVVKICENLSEQYPKLNKELLICAAIFHKVGKIYEYEYETHLDFSEEGKLIGYIPISLQILEKGISKVLDFPTKIDAQLKHLILAQNQEIISETKLLEAEILRKAIQLDILLNLPKT